MWRSTPNAVMRAILELPFLTQCIREEASKTAYRVSCLVAESQVTPHGGYYSMEYERDL